MLASAENFGLYILYCTHDSFFTAQEQYWWDANTETMHQQLGRHYTGAL